MQGKKNLLTLFCTLSQYSTVQPRLLATRNMLERTLGQLRKKVAQCIASYVSSPFRYACK